MGIDCLIAAIGCLGLLCLHAFGLLRVEYNLPKVEKLSCGIKWPQDRMALRQGVNLPLIARSRIRPQVVLRARPIFRWVLSAMARGKVCQCDSVILTVLVACADCVNLSPPSPASGLAPCGWVLWGDPTPGWPEGASCRCAPLPAWPSQLVRQGPVGPPRFRASPSARATLLDPDRPARTLPLSAWTMLGSATVTSSPPVLRLSRLDCFSGMRVPLAARAWTWVRLSDGRLAR
jgi:hypothetical protein